MKHLRVVAMVAGILLAFQGDGIAQQCLHGPDQSTEQSHRRRAAMDFVRDFNAAQSRQQRETGRYAALREVRYSTAVPFGFVPRVMADAFGYMVKLTDALDPCEFTLFSDERGVVYEAQPIRAEIKADTSEPSAPSAAEPALP